MDNVTNLTAVSGVITLPSLDKTPPAEPPLPSDDDGRPSDVAEETGVARQEEEAAAVARRRREEKERRREELKAKNEQRRREREAKRNRSSGKVTLLSMTELSKDSVESAGDAHSGQMSPHSGQMSPPFEKGSFSDDMEEKLEEPEEASKDEDDWSDWDDVSQPGSTYPDPDLNQSGAVLLERGDQQEPVETSACAEVDDDWSRVSDDSTLESAGQGSPQGSSTSCSEYQVTNHKAKQTGVKFNSTLFFYCLFFSNTLFFTLLIFVF